tara:strand:- start:157 stop:285 length:129 start_codon:yes stop_codon:yes gene_type:complete
MPKVGNKSYSYGPKGVAAAQKEAKRTGKKMATVKKKSPKKKY